MPADELERRVLLVMPLCGSRPGRARAVGVAVSGVEVCRIAAAQHGTVHRQHAGPERLMTTARSTFAPAEGAERRSPHGLRLKSSPSRKEKATRTTARAASAPDGNFVGLMQQQQQLSFPRPKATGETRLHRRAAAGW